MLQTAKTKVFKPDYPQGTRNVRLIFDSGSQRSYITNKLKEVLSLRPRHTESMIIKTFGSSKGERQLCDVVSIGLYIKNGSMEELSLLSVPLARVGWYCSFKEWYGIRKNTLVLLNTFTLLKHLV